MGEDFFSDSKPVPGDRIADIRAKTIELATVLARTPVADLKVLLEDLRESDGGRPMSAAIVGLAVDRARGAQPVPEMETVDRDVTDMGRRLIAAPGDGYDVYSWSPGRAGEGVPSTQVHLVLPVDAAKSVALKLKSPRALDELVGALLQHRRDVWPTGRDDR